MEQCGRKGIRRVIIESGGFGEYDESGRELGTKLKSIAQRYDIRFIGPNCIGIINSANGLCVPFPTLKNTFRRGGIGIIAQSGGVALTFLNMFDGEKLGYSKFAAVGNKLNIDENDLIEYYVDDPETATICLYLESIGDGRRLMEIGRRSEKPIIVHKANIAPLSSVIAHSHTQALANDDQVVDAALRQAGMVRLRDMQRYLDFVKILQLPPMNGKNLAIVSRSGGHAVIAADAAFTYGFDLPDFRPEFLDEIKKRLRADVIRLTNPLDLGDLFDFDMYVKIVERTLQEENVDGLLFLHTYFAVIEGEASRKLLQAVALLAGKYGKPVALCISTDQQEMSWLHKDFDFPIFLSPERAVHALNASIGYRTRRNFIAADRVEGEIRPAADTPAIANLLETVRQERRSPLLHEALAIVRSAGIPVPDYRVLVRGSEAAWLEDGLQGPYAVKIVAAGVSHKSDAGGVVLNLPDREAVLRVSEQMMERFGSSPNADGYGVLVQTMEPATASSHEFIIGARRDPSFGPVILLGHGGIFAEILGKTSLRIAPLSPAEVDGMIDELPASEVFKGARGRDPIDRTALREAILRLAHLMVQFPDIDQIDINPIVATAGGVTALDARIVRA